ncbi:Peripheral-type benzodiazepine receptor-associated protein 1 [Dirofilaria immitis]|nr:Peripheral-type benzodiazepine receptor-associated protein 1 [Dirofilaria immitis]
MPLAYTASGSVPHSHDHCQHLQHSTTSLLTVQKSSGSSQDTRENPTSIIYHSHHNHQPQRQQIVQLQQPFSTATKSYSTIISDALLLALRRRPAARLFRALFQYIPIRDSPNENPQLELPLQAGDYILVHGEMDEDQFYHGETLDGQTGLVPSNYVERVPNQQLLLNSFRVRSPSFPLTVPPHLTQIQHDFSTTSVLPGAAGITATVQPSTTPPLPDSVCPYPPIDIAKVTVQEVKITDNPRVPFPQELTVEKKMSRSCVISWSAPDDSLTPISQYHVCVDSIVRAVVPGSFKCKALIEDIDLSKPINLSVRAVTENGHSPDAACTISLGKDAPIAPQHVRIWSITPISACVSWYPSDSNAEHIILLNAVKVGMCPPSVFQVQLNGLLPSTIYRVSVRTKHPKAVLEQRPVERCCDFKTLPKIGLPDPPSNVQVEIGPQPGTLLVSWTPVTSQPLPPSRAAVHSYLVYADGRNIAQVPSVNADHVLLRLSDFADDPPIFITVRTRTKEGSVSSDSNVCRVPRGITNTTELTNRTTTIGIQPNHLNLIQTVPATDTRSSLIPSLVPMNVTGGQSMGKIATATPDNLLNNSIIISRPSATTAYGSHHITPGSSMLARYSGIDQMHIGEHHQLVQSNSGSGGGGGGRGGGTGASAGSSDLLMTVGGQLAGLGTVPVTNTLNSYTTTGIAAANSPLLNVPGNGKLGYSGTAGINYDGLLKSYQTSGTLHEQWKSPNQYYIFHPHALRRDLTTTEEKPSVLEMEHNYLLKHRIQPWSVASQNSRARFDHYLRNRGDDRSGRPLANFPTRSGNFLPVPVARVRTEELCSTRSEPDLRPMALDDYSCRWFVALFDYSHHMSPNANAQQEELSFRKHQLIKVFGDVDQDGFYTGQIGHRIGLVPSNMVIEIAKDDLMPPQRRRSDAATSLEPSLRRMRWGSLKSRSYDHASDRRLPRSRMILVDGDQYPSIDRRDHSLPNRSSDYFAPPFRRMPVGDYRMLSARSEYGGRGGTGAATDEYDIYPPNGRHTREYYSYTRDHRPRETTAERDRREYYMDERDLSERERTEFYESEGSRDPRERDMRGYREIREGRDIRDYRDFRDPKYQRESSLTRRERDYLEEHDDQRMRDYRDTREYRDQREAAEYREIRKERESEQGARDARNYERRTDYSRIEKGHGPIREYNVLAGGTQPYYPSEAATEDSRHSRINGGMPVRKFVAKFDYDSRELSPNVDAEQVELSFHAGDVITVYGEMDEDGFFMGELNGIRGLVPSNFLHTSTPNLLMPTQMPPQQQQQSSQVVPPITIPIPEQQAKPKGVVFQENAKKSMPARQGSQISSSGKFVPQASTKAKSGVATSTQKILAKKPSEIGPKATPNARKTSQTGKKKVLPRYYC